MKTYFTIEELCRSYTADNLGIDNTPPKYVELNLRDLIEFLNPLREAWGSPIIINSGYRCPELNKAVGGVPTSAHQTGNAVDMHPQNGKMEEFKQFCLDYCKDKDFDQLILENSGATEWVHLGLFNNNNEQRHQMFKLTK